ncbi:hypothetical protein ABPG74_009987 [Tetrahymena malaccensis]
MEQNQVDNIMKCQKHVKNDIIYLQINEIKENNSVFYCEICVNRDFNFKPQNFVRIKEILDYSKDSVIFNWPPLDSHDIQQRLIEIFENGDKKSESLKKRIEDYFENLKIDTISKIDDCKNQFLKYVTENPFSENSIKSKYEEFSKGDQLNQIIKEKTHNPSEGEQNYRNFIIEFIEKKKENSDNLSNMIEKNNQIYKTIDFEKLNQIKQMIIADFDQINCILQSNRVQTLKNDILESLEFIKSKHDTKYQDLHIERDNLNHFLTLKIQEQELGYGTYYYSNKILEKNKKYRFKLKVSNVDISNSARFGFGLCRDQIKDSAILLQDNIFFHARLSQFSLNPTNLTNSVIKLVKGDFKHCSKEIEIEINIFLEQKIFNIIEANHNFEITVADQYKENLSNYESLRFYLLLDTFIQFQFIEAIEI